MTVRIGDVVFDQVDYDEDADVLYLHVGDPSVAVGFDESPEGHALRFDQSGHLIGVTIVGVGHAVHAGEHLSVTIPSRVEIDTDQLEAAITAA